MTLKEGYIKTVQNLKKGDKIGIISTARKINNEELKFAVQLIEKWGLVPVLGQNIYSSDNQYAGNDSQRIEDMQSMLDNSEIKAILCARGGYGSVRIIDRLDFSAFKNRPKWIAGFSDVTVIHSHISNFNVPTLHSTMPINFKSNTAASVDSLKKALFGEDIDIKCVSHPLNKNGKGSGQIVGGNLSILYSLIGSASDIDTEGKILFIEDLDEYLYHIDRMMMSLKRSGKLSFLKGLVVGGMTKMNDNITPFGKTAEQIILDAVSEYDYPVCFDFPSGHIDNNLALKLGAYVRLDVGKDTLLHYE
ncbi:MAG: LD-carboxypeptidase [Flavobacteriales bacterium]|nr:LD-carboxypeptidase [Flavobacteriales bacterium]